MSIKPFPFNGYAPGNYMNTCAYCKKDVYSVDKLCFVCLECAIIMAKEEISAKELLKESANVRDISEPPMLAFYKIAQGMENPHRSIYFSGNVFKEGDSVAGSWVDYNGRTYYQSGKLVHYPATGLWVESEYGITEVRFFFTMRKAK